MDFGKLLALPETRYIAIPVAASFLGLLLTLLSRPYGHKTPKPEDWQIGLGWNITALIVWSTEAAIRQSSNSAIRGGWWTPIALAVLLGVSVYGVLEYGWERDKNQHVIPLKIQGAAIGLPLIFGGLSLFILYSQLK